MTEEKNTGKRSRRQFLKLAGTAAGTVLLGACAAPAAPAPAAAPTTAPVAASGATAAPAKAAATAAPTPTPLPTVNAPAGGIKIIWWRSLTGKNGSTLDAMAKRFNESQNKIAVQVEFQGAYGELRDKLVAATAAGGRALPDVVMISDVMMPAFAAQRSAGTTR